MTLRTLQKSIDFEALGLKPRGCVADVRADFLKTKVTNVKAPPDGLVASFEGVKPRRRANT